MNILQKPRGEGGAFGHACLASLLLLLPLVAAAQTAPATISGTVLDAATNRPVSRALVKLTGQPAPRAVLTDPSGNFTFPEVDPANITLTAQKPGFYFTHDPNDPRQIHIKAEDADKPVQLRLYPEALLAGTLIGPDGDPLPHVGVQALRGIDDDLGRHWISNAMTRTDARGMFSIAVPAGNYRVQTELSRNSGNSAVMPVSLPNSGETVLHLQAGEQRELDIHPRLAPLIAVSARLDTPADQIGELLGVLPDGTSFPVSFSAAGSSTITAQLPAGSYILQARRRGFGTDALEQASLTLYPSAKQPIALTLQFVPIASIPVEISLDDAAVAAAATAGQTLTLPTARSFGLSLEPTSPLPVADAEYLRTGFHRGDPGVTFTAPPGTYRLRAQRNYGWTITSALYGGTDILAHDLTIAAGSGSTPIQITVSNQLATITGNVTLDGAPAVCWIYLVAATPAATPVVTIRSGEDGSFNQSIPPGSYHAFAYRNRHSPDPESFGRDAGTAITATPSQKTTVTLEATPEADAHP